MKAFRNKPERSACPCLHLVCICVFASAHWLLSASLRLRERLRRFQGLYCLGRSDTTHPGSLPGNPAPIDPLLQAIIDRWQHEVNSPILRIGRPPELSDDLLAQLLERIQRFVLLDDVSRQKLLEHSRKEIEC